jgi:hypothetical protein
MFDGPTTGFLPRVFCYVDDCIGDDHELHCEFAGELLAIREYNDAHPRRKIAKIHGLRHKRKIPQAWNDMMFAAHLFDHPQYNTYTNPRWAAKAHTPVAAKPLAPRAPGVVVRATSNGVLHPKPAAATAPSRK